MWLQGTNRIAYTNVSIANPKTYMPTISLQENDHQLPKPQTLEPYKKNLEYLHELHTHTNLEFQIGKKKNMQTLWMLIVVRSFDRNKFTYIHNVAIDDITIKFNVNITQCLNHNLPSLPTPPPTPFPLPFSLHPPFPPCPPFSKPG